MLYHLKGLIARIIDIFDPDDVEYIVSNPEPESLAPHVQQHIQSKL